MTLLEVRALTARRDGLTALDGAALAVAPGEVVGLIGPNGAGKSTLMRAALGLIPAEGLRLLGGDPVAGLTPRERARRAAWLPQEREIAWPISVRTLVALGRAPWRSASAPLNAGDHAAIDAAMVATDVARFADRPATALSGGERARVLIARALAQQTPLVVADEPAAGLDPAHQIALMQAFRALAAEGRGALVSMHDLGLAARSCDRLVALSVGRVAASGTPAEVLTPARLSAIYGVTARIVDGPGGLSVAVTGLAGPSPER